MGRNFSLANDRVDLGDIVTARFLDNTAWSSGIFFRATDMSSNGTVLAKWGTNPIGRQFRIRVQTFGAIQARFNSDVVTLSLSGGSILIDTWYMVAVTCSSIGVLNLYVFDMSGSLVGTDLDNHPGDVADLTQPITLGIEDGDTTEFVGDLAHAFYLGEELSQSQLNQLVYNPWIFVSRSDNRIFYMPLDGITSPEPDYSGNGHSGVLTGTSSGDNPPVSSVIPMQHGSFDSALVIPPVIPVIPTFGGAEGAGALTIAGRGGSIVFVSNLNNSGVGSLRTALSVVGPKIIIFLVAGTIQITSALELDTPFCTIAGETAFRNGGQGISIRGEAFLIRTHDVCVRYMRFGATAENCSNPACDDMDSLRMTQSGIIDPDREVYDVVIDHCSVFWGVDESFSIWNTEVIDLHNVTVQKCMIYEGLSNSEHSEGEHSKGLLIGDPIRDISVHHCLFAHNVDRNPRSKGSREEIINNIVYNWDRSAISYGALVASGEAPCDCNIIGGTYIPGPNTGSRRYSITLFGSLEPHKVYLDDNLGNGDDGTGTDIGDPNASGWLLCGEETICTNPATAGQQVFVPNTIVGGVPVTVQPRATAYTEVLNDAGAALYRIPHEDAIVNDVINGTGSIIDNPSDVGGWPVLLDFSTPIIDSDLDGMPDAWEILNGLDPNGSPSDSADNDLDPNYTNIEVYLNEIAGDPPF